MRIRVPGGRGSIRVPAAAWICAAPVVLGFCLLIGLLVVGLLSSARSGDGSRGRTPLGAIAIGAVAIASIVAGFLAGRRGLRGARIEESPLVTGVMHGLGAGTAVLGVGVLAVSAHAGSTTSQSSAVAAAGAATLLVAAGIAAAARCRACRPVGAIASRAVVLFGSMLFPLGTVLAGLYLCSNRERVSGGAAECGGGPAARAPGDRERA